MTEDEELEFVQFWANGGVRISVCEAVGMLSED